jgi:hypothetical protein
MGDSTSSYATAGIALRVSGALKSHHHDKVDTNSYFLCNEMLFLGLINEAPLHKDI